MGRTLTCLGLVLVLVAGTVVFVQAQEGEDPTGGRSSLGERFSRLRSSLWGPEGAPVDRLPLATRPDSEAAPTSEPPAASARIRYADNPGTSSATPGSLPATPFGAEPLRTPAGAPATGSAFRDSTPTTDDGYREAVPPATGSGYREAVPEPIARPGSTGRQAPATGSAFAPIDPRSYPTQGTPVHTPSASRTTLAPATSPRMARSEAGPQGDALRTPQGEEEATSAAEASVEATTPAPLHREPTSAAPLPSPRPGYREADVEAEAEVETSTGRPADERVLFSRSSPVLMVETTGPRRIVIGKEAIYKVYLKNSGNSAAREVLVTVKVPDWAEIAGADAGSSGFVSRAGDKADTIQWSMKRLDPQAAEELTLHVIPRQGLPFDLSVQVTHSPVASQASVEVSEPKLLMSLSGPTEVVFGRQELFRLILSNPGTADAENVELKLFSATPGEAPPPAHKIGVIPAGDKKVVELELTARQGGSLKIHAVASASGGLRAETAESVLVRKPDLRVTVGGPKFRYAGTAGTYEITITNPGNAQANNVQIVALVPPGSKYVSCSNRGTYDAERGKVSWRLASLDAGAEYTIAWRCELGEPGQTRIQAACAADNGLKDSASTLTEVEAIADLMMTVADPRGPIPVGEEVVYEIKLVNRGTRRAEDVRVSAFLSAGLKPLASVDGHPYKIQPGQVTFDPIESLSPGQTYILIVRTTGMTSGNHVFRAELKCDSLDTSIAEEENTRFYADDSIRSTEAARPAAPASRSTGREPSARESAPDLQPSEAATTDVPESAQQPSTPYRYPR